MMISLPRSILLKLWVLWIIAKCTLKISYEFNSPSAPVVQQNINNFGYELILPWFTGAMWSSFKPIQYLVIFLQICLVLLVCFRVNGSIIKKLVWFLFILAMYVIWLEPWLQMLVDPWSAKWFADLGALVIMTLFVGIVDIGFTALWLCLTWLICRQLDRDF